jgi:hypothetical protein
MLLVLYQVIHRVLIMQNTTLFHSFVIQGKPENLDSATSLIGSVLFVANRSAPHPCLQVYMTQNLSESTRYFASSDKVLFPHMKLHPSYWTMWRIENIIYLRRS